MSKTWDQEINCGTIISDEVGKALVRRLKIQVNAKLKEENIQLKQKNASMTKELRTLRKEQEGIKDLKAARHNVYLACRKLTRIIKNIEKLKNRKVGTVINEGSSYYRTVLQEGRAIAAVTRLAKKNTK